MNILLILFSFGLKVHHHPVDNAGPDVSSVIAAPNTIGIIKFPELMT